MKITLVGYMGSGKSTIGKLLGQELSIPFLDLDQQIEKAEKQTVKEIFTQKGELYFREKESEVLQEIIIKKKEFVLSLGGGTPIFFNHPKLINHYSTSFYLKASPKVLAKRLYENKETRPLIRHIQTVEELKSFIFNHLLDREPFYCQSKHTVWVDNLSPTETILEIINKIS